MKQIFIRLSNTFFGTFLFALGVVATIKANVGYAPWEVFHAGLADTLGLPFGVTTVIAGAAVLIIAIALGEKFGLGTIASIVMTGIFIDLILMLGIVPVMDSFAAGIIMLIAGMFILSIGSFFYIKSAFGAGPRDSIMVALARKTKLPVGVCRSAIELTVTLIGWLLGGMVGIGTIISVVAIGFCIQITFKALKFDVTSVEHENIADTYRNLRASISKG